MTEEKETEVTPPKCGFVPQHHTWIGTGFPGGKAWCKYCNVDYSPDLDGSFLKD